MKSVLYLKIKSNEFDKINKMVKKKTCVFISGQRSNLKILFFVQGNKKFNTNKFSY